MFLELAISEVCFFSFGGEVCSGYCVFLIFLLLIMMTAAAAEMSFEI